MKYALLFLLVFLSSCKQPQTRITEERVFKHTMITSDKDVVKLSMGYDRFIMAPSRKISNIEELITKMSTQKAIENCDAIVSDHEFKLTLTIYKDGNLYKSCTHTPPTF